MNIRGGWLFDGVKYFDGTVQLRKMSLCVPLFFSPTSSKAYICEGESSTASTEKVRILSVGGKPKLVGLRDPAREKRATKKWQ